MTRSPMSAQQTLDREFLQMRAKILELAASFDRLARADAGELGDPRVEHLRNAIHVVLQSEGADRAEQVQQVFSRPYDPAWRQSFQLG